MKIFQKAFLKNPVLPVTFLGPWIRKKEKHRIQLSCSKNTGNLFSIFLQKDNISPSNSFTLFHGTPETLVFDFHTDQIYIRKLFGIPSQEVSQPRPYLELNKMVISKK